MRRLILFVGLMSCAFSAGFSHAYVTVPLDEIENPGVPVVQPSTTIPFNQQASPGDIALSSDGQHLVYSESTTVLDVWSALVHLWPEIVLGLTCVLVLWRVWAGAMRRRRYPSEKGPYCAKCAYPTQGLAGGDCPECGNALTKSGTTRGTTRERVLFTQLILVGVAGLVGVCYFLDPPRDIFVKRWITWHSEGWVDWANKQQTIDLDDSIRYCTSLRSMAINNPSSVRTIFHVPNTDEYGLLKNLAHTIYFGPRPNGFERIVSNTPQTHAGVSTADFYAVVDLETLRVSDAGQLKDEARHFNGLSDDGRYRVGYGWVNEDGLEIDELDGTHVRVLPVIEEQIADLTIRVRRAGSLSPNGLVALGIDGKQHESEQPDPHQEQVIRILQRGSDEACLYRAYEWTSNVHMYVQADYALLMGSQSVVVYDLRSDQWLAQLDLSAFTPGIWKPDGTSIAVSADRSTAAVINADGSQVAVYDLPKPKQK